MTRYSYRTLGVCMWLWMVISGAKKRHFIRIFFVKFYGNVSRCHIIWKFEFRLPKIAFFCVVFPHMYYSIMFFFLNLRAAYEFWRSQKSMGSDLCCAQVVILKFYRFFEFSCLRARLLLKFITTCKSSEIICWYCLDDYIQIEN